MWVKLCGVVLLLSLLLTLGCLSDGNGVSKPTQVFSGYVIAGVLYSESPPPFSVGDQFTYTLVGGEGNITLKVVSLESIDGIDCFILISSNGTEIKNRDGEEITCLTSGRFYVNAVTGNLLKSIITIECDNGYSDITEYPSDLASYMGLLPYCPWMNIIDNSSNWIISYNTSPSNDVFPSVVRTIDYGVEGVQEINGRNCFRVRVKRSEDLFYEGDLDNRITVSWSQVVYVDVEKHILLKSITYTENNTKTSEVYLISKL